MASRCVSLTMPGFRSRACLTSYLPSSRRSMYTFRRLAMVNFSQMVEPAIAICPTRVNYLTGKRQIANDLELGRRAGI